MRQILILSLVAATLIFGHSSAAATYEDGLALYDTGDYAGAMEVWRPLAEAGDRDAQYRMGWLYEDGEGVPRDASVAIEWFLRAALLGNVKAQTMMGYKFAKGEGVRASHQKAKCWYLHAAAQGEPQAQLNLGSILKRGEGPKNNMYWTERAARQGHARAMSILGWVRWWNPLERDKTEAYMYFLLAADKGDTEAIEYLAEIRADKRPKVQRELAAAEKQAAAWEPVFEERPAVPLPVPSKCLP